MTMVSTNQVSSTRKMEYIKSRFVSLRDNLVISKSVESQYEKNDDMLQMLILDFLSEIGGPSEEQIDNYNIMKIKTNFFIDEIDFHLRGDVTSEQLMVCVATLLS